MKVVGILEYFHKNKLIFICYESSFVKEFSYSAQLSLQF